MPLPGVSNPPARYIASKTLSACSSETIILITSFCSSMGAQRESEANIQALRDTMERMRNDYEEKLDNERAVHQGAQRESEANIQALRDTMERMRNDYEEKLDRERASNENSKRDSEASIQALRKMFLDVRHAGLRERPPISKEMIKNLMEYQKTSQHGVWSWRNMVLEPLPRSNV